MSAETQNSQQSGQSRRRRSRGGQNRNRNNNSGRENSDGRQSNGRQSGGGKKHPGNQTSEVQRRPMPAPKLTFWQKLLKAVGLYSEPTRPPRPERRPDAPSPKKESEPRRSKTRDVRTESSSSRKEESRKRDEKRRDRGPVRDKRPRGGDPSTVGNRRVYVGNLSYDTTESDLEELFKGVGAVRRVEIVYNRKTHRSKGYGFIEMIDIDEAKRTVEVLHDQHFMGRQLTVSGAKSKDYEDAENEEGGQPSAVQEMPPLAPKNPAKEQVLDLLDVSETDKPSGVATEEVINEIPTEEFSHENQSHENSENEVKS